MTASRERSRILASQVKGMVAGKIVYAANGDFNQSIPARNGLGDVVTEGSWASDGHMLREFFGYYRVNTLH